MRILCLLLAVPLAWMLTGCGDEESAPGPTGPTVLETSPANGATDVSPYPTITARFSGAIDAATVDSLSFHIDGVSAHSVTYDAADHIATLIPATALKPDSVYTVHVENTIRDTEGTALDHTVVFSFTTGPLDCEHLGDGFEPNDDVDSAAPIELDTDYHGLSSCGTDITDCFQFTLTDTAKVTVITENAYIDSERVSWKINFWRGEGDAYCTLGTSMWQVGSPPSLHYTFLPGTYFVEVGRYYGDTHTVIYHLKAETSAPALDDQYEDNDFPDEARPIEPGLHESLRGAFVDADYFSIDLNSGQTLTVTATEITSTGALRTLGIADTLSSINHTDQDNPAVETWTATVTGKHVIQVRWFADDVIYNLDVEVSG